MKVELHEITVGEVAACYIDNDEEGVVGYSGRLNIRPKYQREFVYDEKKRNAVMDTISKGFPLNVIYWAVNKEGSYEVLDGQQRTISFCQYVAGEYSINDRFFHNLTKSKKEEILNYKLMVYFCEGNDQEKLDWFRIVNIAGLKLTEQELRNAVYTGPWLSDAKLKFSKTNCAAYGLSKDYVVGSPIRQDFLEKALCWISNDEIEKYMSIHQHDPNANELWLYFKNVIDWVQLTFTVKRREMKGVDWGTLYNQFKDELYDTEELEREVKSLMVDDDVSNKKGVYPYVLDRQEKNLNIRNFSDSQKRAAYERQNGVCPGPFCGGKHFEFDDMEADHITPWHEGGKTIAENCQMLCRECNRRKSGK